MIQQKLSLFQCLTSVPSKAVGLEEVVRLIHYDSGVVGRGLSSRKVSLVMVRLGFKTVHTKAGNFFELYQIPANEIQPTLAYVDETEADTSSLPTMTEGNLPF